MTIRKTLLIADDHTLFREGLKTIILIRYAAKVGIIDIELWKE